jgi:hypothetical protein
MRRSLTRRSSRTKKVWSCFERNDFKIDENLPTELADDLRQPGHDADTVLGEGLRGAKDPAVVEAARASDRILFTLDKGIAGVVLFRPDTSGRRAVMSFVRTRLSALLQMELAGRLTVVGPARIRFR